MSVDARRAGVHAEIASQADVMAATLQSSAPVAERVAAAARARGVERLLLVGAGSSLHAAQAIRWWMEEVAGLPCEPMETLEYLGYGYRRDSARTLIVVISASGRRSLTEDALRRALAGPGLVVGQTDGHRSPFATDPPFAFKTSSTKVTGWPSQTTTVAMTVLAALAVALAPPGARESAAAQLAGMPALLAQSLAHSERPMQALADQLAGDELFGFVGAGPAWGVACDGVMLVTMATAACALALETEEFHHGAQAAALIYGGAPLFILAPTGAGYRRAIETVRTIEAAGGTAIVLGPPTAAEEVGRASRFFPLPAVAESLSPFVYLPALHWFGFYLALAKVRRDSYPTHAMLIRALHVEPLSTPVEP